MLYKMTERDYINEKNEYIIWCDNSIPIELEIVPENGKANKCWLAKAEYIPTLDKYMARYKSYTTTK